MRLVDATAYLQPYPARRVRRPVRIRETDDTYPLEPSPEQSWLPIAFRAFAALGRSATVEDLLVVGTGTGLDVLGALETLPGLRRVTATDVHRSCVEVARENVVANLAASDDVALDFQAGSLMAPVPARRRFDLVYENLPNLPAPAELELRRGAIGGRFFDDTGLDVPETFAVHRLALHHRLLRDARPHVRAGGGVLTALGGRVPRSVVLELHRSCGYEPEVVAFDVKIQVEPELVVPPYARAEEAHDVRFIFYAADAIGLVARARAAGLEGDDLAGAVDRDLDRLALSAGEADELVRRGTPVAHSVLMVIGRPLR
jgi:methylase of polypeptide subunit release factors